MRLGERSVSAAQVQAICRLTDLPPGRPKRLFGAGFDVVPVYMQAHRLQKGDFRFGSGMEQLDERELGGGAASTFGNGLVPRKVGQREVEQSVRGATTGNRRSQMGASDSGIRQGWRCGSKGRTRIHPEERGNV